jgi:hypothetical protein
MTLPTILTYAVNPKEIVLCWKASPKSDIRQWNLYGSSSVTIDMNTAKGVDLSSFNLIKGNITNYPSTQAAGNVLVTLSREDLNILPEDNFYFAITSIDKDGHESAVNKNKLHAVPADDDYFVDEAGQPTNIVYKNFEFNMSKTEDWDSDRFLDMISLLGRPAKQLRIVSKDSNIQIRVNSITSDLITIDSEIEFPFSLARGELQFKKVWFNKTTEGSTLIRMFVAG